MAKRAGQGSVGRMNRGVFYAAARSSPDLPAFWTEEAKDAYDWGLQQGILDGYNAAMDSEEDEEEDPSSELTGKIRDLEAEVARLTTANAQVTKALNDERAARAALSKKATEADPNESNRVRLIELA